MHLRGEIYLPCADWLIDPVVLDSHVPGDWEFMHSESGSKKSPMLVKTLAV